MGCLDFPFKIEGFILPAAKKIMSWHPSAVKPCSRIESAEEHLLAEGGIVCPLAGETPIHCLVDVGV